MNSNPYKLTEFQKATVDRIFQIFHGDDKTPKQNRVLLADEVGLGKTIVARAVIDRVYEWHINEGDDLFKVVYICSNESIAHQNESKLGIARDSQISIADGRLTMQHLQIAKKEAERAKKDEEQKEEGANTEKKNFQLLPMTPSTSLDLKNGRGTVQERALMFCILKEFLNPDKLDTFFRLDYKNESEWEKQKNKYQKQIKELRVLNSNYPTNIIRKLQTKLNSAQFQEFMDCFKPRKKPESKSLFTEFVPKLRQLFAEISLDELKPDLIIMDEFQRFNSLIKSAEDSDDSELGKLCNKIFNNKVAPNKNKELKTKILLLSATPYKPFSTLAEAMEKSSLKNSTEQDRHYEEFKSVFRFLYGDKNSDKNFGDFETVWSDYSNSLQELRNDNWSVLVANKNKAETELRSVLTRTERRNDSIIKTPSLDNRENWLKIEQGDVLSYFNVCKFTQLANLPPIPVEYAKSSPYLLSFMRDTYKIFNKLQTYFSRRPKIIPKDDPSLIFFSFLNEKKINAYQEIPTNNARLQALYDEILPADKKTELLLWVPPSHPYYSAADSKKFPVGKVFDDNKGFSKLLLFSAWEMVPRMTAAMTSYEAERRVFSKKPGNKKYKYFELKISPALSKNNNKGPYELLTHPSDFLAKIYNPSEFEGRSLSDILEELKNHIQDEILKLNGSQIIDSVKLNSGQILSILKTLDDSSNSKQNERGITIPKAALEVLSYMAVASPAVCALRTLHQFFSNSLSEDPHDIARRLAEGIVAMFSRSAQPIVKLAFKNSRRPYYFNVLRYCAEGNFQAMLDEYAFICVDSDQFIQTMAPQNDDDEADEEDDEDGENEEQKVPYLRIYRSSTRIDTYKSFMSWGAERTKKQKTMRTNFAIGYCNLKLTDKAILRTDDIRTAFNMPFRPFVLSTTSIGQEGLDFHSYCRKIMHWNLPCNPIDLEQREGRINRYLSLAIRQSLANSSYADGIPIQDFWKKLINNVISPSSVDANDQSKPDLRGGLVPYWIFPNKNQTENDEKPKDEKPKFPIERIVPMYPFSKDQNRYKRNIDVLSFYRLTLGQPNQEELLKNLIAENVPDEKLKELFFNLSPWSYAPHASSVPPCVPDSKPGN